MGDFIIKLSLVLLIILNVPTAFARQDSAIVPGVHPMDVAENAEDLRPLGDIREGSVNSYGQVRTIVSVAYAEVTVTVTASANPQPEDGSDQYPWDGINGETSSIEFPSSTDGAGSHGWPDDGSDSSPWAEDDETSSVYLDDWYPEETLEVPEETYEPLVETLYYPTETQSILAEDIDIDIDIDVDETSSTYYSYSDEVEPTEEEAILWPEETSTSTSSFIFTNAANATLTTRPILTLSVEEASLHRLPSLPPFRNTTWSPAPEPTQPTESDAPRNVGTYQVECQATTDITKQDLEYACVHACHPDNDMDTDVLNDCIAGDCRCTLQYYTGPTLWDIIYWEPSENDEE